MRTRLLVLLGIGLALRLALVSIPSTHTDALTFREWGRVAADRGTACVWSEGGSNYMPVYPALLGVATRIFRAATGREGDSLPTWALKAMPIAADLLTTLALFVFLRKGTGQPIAAAIAGAHFVNPAILIDSAAWGQVDAFHSLLVLLSLAFAHWGKTRHDAWNHAAWIAFTLAVLFKLQAIVLGPLLLVATVPGRKKGAVVTSALAALGVLAAALVPLFLSGALRSFLDLAVLGATSRYERLTLKAFNLWWLFPRDVVDRVRDVDSAVAGISYRAVGLVLFGIAYAFFLHCFWRAGRALRADVLFLAGGGVAVAFFVLCTQMHERYLFQAIPLLAVAAAYRSGFGWAIYGLFSFTAAANLFLSLARLASTAPAGEGSGSWILPSLATGVALANGVGLAALAYALGRPADAALVRAPVNHRVLPIAFVVSSAIATLFFLAYGIGIGRGKVGRVLPPGRTLARNRNETMPAAFQVRNDGDCSLRIEGFEERRQRGSVVLDVVVAAGQSATIDLSDSKPKSVKLAAGREGGSGASLTFKALNRRARPSSR